MILISQAKSQTSSRYKSRYVGLLVLQLVSILNPWLIVKTWPAYIFSIGITLVDVHLGSCVRYIFASLHYKFKRDHLKNQENYFLFHFEGFFNLWEWIFKFSNIQISWRHEMPKHEKWNRFYWITWKVNTAW